MISTLGRKCTNVQNVEIHLVENLHLLSHSGDKPHQCYERGKSFIKVGELKKHLRMYSLKNVLQYSRWLNTGEWRLWGYFCVVWVTLWYRVIICNCHFLYLFDGHWKTTKLYNPIIFVNLIYRHFDILRSHYGQVKKVMPFQAVWK